MVTPISTDAQDAGKKDTGTKGALMRRRLEALSPYDRGAWARELQRYGLQGRYPSLVQGLTEGFNLGIPRILHMHIPPNNISISILPHVYTEIIENEFRAGRYVGPFTRKQVEAKLGPFQTSPLSLVPKTSKPGKNHAVHNFSHPHSPRLEVSSVNSHISSNDFPCTLGTFTAIALLIAHLPPGSQASVQDVAEAYRTIPAHPNQWPGLIIRLQGEDSFAINVCNNFGLTSAGGVYGLVADAGADIFCSRGIGPLAKWVDDVMSW